MRTQFLSLVRFKFGAITDAHEMLAKAARETAHDGDRSLRHLLNTGN
jgi:hypothetical protein